MEFDKLILDRESIRSYDPDRRVEEASLRKILEAGRIAPTAKNLQPFKFLMISSVEMLEKVRPCYARPWFSKAPHILAVKGERSKAWVREQDGYNSLETDLTIAMDHMILAAWNEGVASCWIEAFDPVKLNEALGLKDSETVFAITPLGYPEAGYIQRGPEKKMRKPLDELVEFL